MKRILFVGFCLFFLQLFLGKTDAHGPEGITCDEVDAIFASNECKNWTVIPSVGLYCDLPNAADYANSVPRYLFAKGEVCSQWADKAKEINPGQNWL